LTTLARLGRTRAIPGSERHDIATIELPDDQIEALAAKAKAQGLSTEEYACRVLLYDWTPAWVRRSWETA